MPVTIGTLTSNVSVVDGSGTLTEDVTEQIVQLAMARMKDDMRSAEEARQESEVRDRRSASDAF